nr:MAG TPA: hypothetical protein [Caudoviricetes sp.]
MKRSRTNFPSKIGRFKSCPRGSSLRAPRA